MTAAGAGTPAASINPTAAGTTPHVLRLTLSRLLAHSLANRSCQAEQAAARRPCSPAGLLWRTYWRLYHWRIVIHLLWTFTEIACRCGSLQAAYTAAAAT